MIFRITWTDGKQRAQWFCEATTKRKAIRMIRRNEKLAEKAIEVREWTHCMAPQHAEIPTVPNLYRHSRQTEPAIAVHEDVPYCATCIKHSLSDMADRVERLERALCELQDRLDCHLDDHS